MSSTARLSSYSLPLRIATILAAAIGEQAQQLDLVLVEKRQHLIIPPFIRPACCLRLFSLLRSQYPIDRRAANVQPLGYLSSAEPLGFEFLHLRLIDRRLPTTSTAAGKCFLDMRNSRRYKPSCEELVDRRNTESSDRPLKSVETGPTKSPAPLSHYGPGSFLRLE